MDAAAVARRIAREIVAPTAAEHDRLARFPEEGVRALGKEGLLGLAVPREHGGLGLGPRAFADATAALAEADASAAMVFVMHVLGTSCMAAAPAGADVAGVLRAAAEGRHLTTLAFSERGSRSHFWAPVSKAARDGDGVRVTADKSFVTSAGRADSFVVTTRSPDATTPTDSTLYLVDARAPGVRVTGKWDGLGLRANDSAAVELRDVAVPASRRLTREGGGLDAKLTVVLPWFNLGCSAVSLGLCRAAVDATVEHLRSTRLEHMGETLGGAFPTLRARLAEMKVEADGVAVRVADLARELESPGPDTMMRVLGAKVATSAASMRVTESALRACGGAAYARASSVERHFRDAQASAVMAPTIDQLDEIIGRALLGMPLL